MKVYPDEDFFEREEDINLNIESRRLGKVLLSDPVMWFCVFGWIAFLSVLVYFSIN